MPLRARYYSAAVVAAAAAAAACALPGTDWATVPRAPFVVLLLLQVGLMLAIRLPLLQESPAAPAMVSVLLAAIVLLPPGAAALSGAVASSCMVLRRADPLRVGFACAVAFLDAAAAGSVYHAVHGESVLTAARFPAALMPIVLAVLVLSVVPVLCMEPYLVLTGQHSAKAAVREGALRTGPRNVAYAFVGLLTAVLWSDGYDALAALVLLGPVVVTRWATLQYEEQRTAHDAIIRTLVQAVEIKDLYTRGHSERVAKISTMIAGELRMPPQRVDVLRYAATLHDVGKLGVPTRLLRKTGRLEDGEFEEIRLHPSRGVEVVRDIAFLDEAYSAILHHHERMDGLGYPSGLRGMRIPPFARIIAVADAFDSMTSSRSYRGARGSHEALAELRANSGTQFDPAIVEAIAAALARAELAGRPWRGDGTASAGAEAARRLRELPPGAVVAEFDHDDPAYQGLMPAVAGVMAAQSGDRGDRPGPASSEASEETPGTARSAQTGQTARTARSAQSAQSAQTGPAAETAAPAHSAGTEARRPGSSPAPAPDSAAEPRLRTFGADITLPAQTGRGPDFALPGGGHRNAGPRAGDALDAATGRARGTGASPAPMSAPAPKKPAPSSAASAEPEKP
jgi:hypothetical protein